jgi:hypothetical protein
MRDLYTYTAQSQRKRAPCKYVVTLTYHVTTSRRHNYARTPEPEKMLSTYM